MWCEKCWVTLAVIAIITSRSAADIQLKDTTEHQDSETVQKIRSQNEENITKSLSNTSTIHSSQILFEVILANSMKNFLPFSNVNKNCVRDGQRYVMGLNNQSRWAIQMYESSAKYPGGDVELGNFDRCMRASSKSLGIRAAYALVQVQINRVALDLTGPNATEAVVTRMPMPVDSVDLLWALCFPDSCAREDVEASVYRALVPGLADTYRVRIDVAAPPSMYTSRRTAMPVTGVAMLAWGIFGFGLTLVIAATAYDWLKKPEDDTVFSHAVRAFSAAINMKKLVQDPKDTEFTIVNGLKTIGLISVILGHRIMFDLMLPVFDTEYTNQILSDFWLSFLKSSTTVEIFFTLSGFFTYATIEKHLTDGKPFKFIPALGYRIIRILPSYATVIAMFALVLPYVDDGPLWNSIIYPDVEFCRKNWWTNLLFINNYVKSNEMCMLHTWYMGCDMHFFIVGIALTYIVWRWKKVGLGIFGILFAASIYVPAKFIYDNRQWGLMPYSLSAMKNFRTMDYFHKVYIKSHHRITTYLIGMATAYVYSQIKNNKLKFSAKSRTIGLIICVLVHCACYMVPGYFYLPGQTYNPWHHVFCFTFQRIVFSLTISYALVIGSLSNFGYFSKLFECKLFVVISRLSYIAYLMHIFVLLHGIGQIRQPFYGSFWSLYWRMNSDVTTTLGYSLLINLIVEAPLRTILQNLMDKKKNND